MCLCFRGNRELDHENVFSLRKVTKSVFRHSFSTYLGVLLLFLSQHGEPADQFTPKILLQKYHLCDKVLLNHMKKRQIL